LKRTDPASTTPICLRRKGSTKGPDRKKRTPAGGTSLGDGVSRHGRLREADAKNAWEKERKKVTKDNISGTTPEWMSLPRTGGGVFIGEKKTRIMETVNKEEVEGITRKQQP